MADWYTKTVLTVIAVCLLFLTGREAVAPSRNYEVSQIAKGLSDLTRSIEGLDKGDPIQKVAICDKLGQLYRSEIENRLKRDSQPRPTRGRG